MHNNIYSVPEKNLERVQKVVFIQKRGHGQLSVKGSSNRMLPQFQEPILGRLRFLELRKHSIRGTFYRQNSP